MQVISIIFENLFFGPVVNLLVAIYRMLSSIGIPGALGFAIILLTVVIRFLVWPFMATQLKSAKKMADLKPQLDELKKKHQGDKQAFASSQMALYKEHGVNPAGGCLPTLIQFPVIIALYQSIFAFFGGATDLERINKILYIPGWKLEHAPDLHFLGINLATKPADFLNGAPFLILIPVITAGLQFLQSRMMVPQPVKEYPSDSPKEKKEKVKEEDTMSAVQSQMTFMMPAMVGYFAFQFPVGLALYWNTFTLLGILQQYRISGWGGLESWIKLLKR